jgi:hypothetical protein
VKMARKRHKPRKKDRQPILENFMQKVAAKAGDNAKYLVNPPGEISMSDAISQLIEPYKDDAPDYKAFRTLVTFGCTAWNASILPQDQRTEMLEKVLAALTAGKKDHAEMLEFVNELMDRKKRLFPHVTRMIVDFKVTDRGDDFHIAVASTLSKPPE